MLQAFAKLASRLRRPLLGPFLIALPLLCAVEAQEPIPAQDPPIESTAQAMPAVTLPVEGQPILVDPEMPAPPAGTPLATETPVNSPAIEAPKAVEPAHPAAPAKAKGPLLAFASPQALRFSVYQRLAEANVLVEAQAVPLANRVNVYVAVGGLSRASIANLKILIDDQVLVDRSMSTPEVSVLAERRWPLRVARTGLAAGSHRLQATVALAAMGEGKGEPPVLQFEQTLEFGDRGSDIELRVESGTFGSPRLSLRRLQRDELRRTSLVGGSLDALGLTLGTLRYAPGAESDPSLGHARSLARMGQIANALIELLSETVQAGPKIQYEAPYWLEQAALLRQLGVLDRAQAICDQLDAVKLSGPLVATERLLIAEARFSQGDYAAAEAQLALSQRQLPEYRRADWRNVSGLIELARLRPGQATDTLKIANSESIDAFRYMAASTEALRATAYGRYNLAIALIRSGDAAHGKSWLDLLGRTTPTDPELLELRDKANVALGWQFLKDRQGRTALGVLGRVRSDGLSSNRALLGMGWAQLAPNGERLPRVTLRNDKPQAPDQLTDLPAPLRNSLTRLKVLEPELTNKLGPVSFERDDPPKDRAEGLRRAILIWTVLLDRDERDPSVIEARLAMGYAQDQLRDIGAARATYSAVLTSLREMDASLQRDAAFVESGQLVSTLSAIDPDDRAGQYGLMNRLRLEPGNDKAALYAAVADQREYRRLSTALANARSRTEALAAGDAVTAMLDKLDIASRQLAIELHAAEKKLNERALVQLQGQRNVVLEYMKTALLLSARAEDTPSLEMRGSENALPP